MSYWSDSLINLKNGMGIFYYPPPSSASTCQQLVADRDQMTLLRKNAYDASKGVSAAKSGDSRYALEIVAFLDANINAYNSLINTCSVLPPAPVSSVVVPENLTPFNDPGVGTVATPVSPEVLPGSVSNPSFPAATTDDVYPSTKTDDVHYPGELSQSLTNNVSAVDSEKPSNKKWIIIGIIGVVVIIGGAIVIKKLRK